MLRYLWPAVLVLGVGAVSLFGGGAASAQEGSTLWDNFINFLYLNDERDDLGEPVTLDDLAAYFGDNYTYLQAEDSDLGLVIYDYTEVDGGSLLVFDVYDGNTVELYEAEIWVDDDMFPPVIPSDFQEWMVDFVEGNLTNIEAVTAGFPLTTVYYVHEFNQNPTLQLIFDYVSVTMDWETSEVLYYTFRHFNDLDDDYYISEEDAEHIAALNDLHVDNIRVLIGEYWRAYYYMDDQALVYYWEPHEGFALVAEVDQEGYVTYYDYFDLDEEE